MRLAVNGGKPVRKELFPIQQTIGPEEQEAVRYFMCDNPILSGYRASFGPNFWGGEEVQAFEKELSKMFYSQALAVNSCTSALQIACGAIGLQPGDEVIVTPYSMTCSATAPMLWGAIPVFADIEKDHFCLDPESVKSKITKKTKAIIVVDLFGQQYNVKAINDIAKENNLSVIEDAAQAIGAGFHEGVAIMENTGEGNCGTFGDIGCFSFTQGKLLTAGEGGAILTNDDELHYKCALIRNHAEAIVNGMDTRGIEYKNMFGFNMRMTEIQAVILREQIKKMEGFVKKRNENVRLLKKAIDIPCIKHSEIRENCTHAHYVMPMFFDEKIAGVHRNVFVEAVKAELTEETNRLDRGVPINAGYITPLYHFPLFRDQLIVPYPNVEKLQKDELIITLYQNLELEQSDIDDIGEAFKKVWDCRDELL